MIMNSIIYFIGGIGLFLYGIKLMSDGLELSTGTKLKRILELLTTNKFLGVFTGFLITAIIQSSTAMTVMVVGFVNAGLLTLIQAAGVIIGANIGTTTTGLLIALNIHSIAPICIFIGVSLLLFAKKKKVKYIGMILAGFGMLFLGMRVMTDAMKPISDLPILTTIFKYTANPFFGLLLGFFVSAIVHSSTAAMGILLAMISAGVITDLNQAIFILYGQNLGTCITAVISSLGLNNNAKKAALIHFVYNFIGISIFVLITLLPLGFIDFIKSLSGNVVQQLVFAHIFVNIVMAIVLFPATGIIVKITEWLIKNNEEEKTDMDFVFIDERLLNNPSFAIVQVYKEIERMANLALQNFLLTKSTILKRSKNSEKDIKMIRKNENIINLLSGKINAFLTELSSTELEISDTKLVATLYRVIIDVERLGNHSVNIIKAYEEIKNQKDLFSDEALKELNSMFNNVERGLTKAVGILNSGKHSKKITNEIRAIEKIVDKENEAYKNNHIGRSNKGICTLESGVAFVKILTDLERISDYACNIAYAQYKKNNLIER